MIEEQDFPTAETPTAKMLSHSRREARWMLAVWLICFLWVIGYCSAWAYRDDELPLKIVFGMPAWVFWGIVLPWLGAVVASCLFALFGMADDDLGNAAEGDQRP